MKVGRSIPIPQPDRTCAQARESHVAQFLLLCCLLVQQEKPIPSSAPGRRLRETASPPPLQHPSLTPDIDGTTSEERRAALSLPPEAIFGEPSCIAPAATTAQSQGWISLNHHFQGFIAPLPASSYSQVLLHFPPKWPEFSSLFSGQG